MDDHESTWSGEPTEEDPMLDDASIEGDDTDDVATLELTPDLETAGGFVEGDVSAEEG